MHVFPEYETNTLRVHIGPITLHVHADDALIFSNLLRKPPAAGVVWLDALHPEHGVRLRAERNGTELACAPTLAVMTWITWSTAVDVVGEITGKLGKLRLPRAT